MAYQESLQKAGFRYARVEDVTDLSICTFAKFRIRTIEKEIDRTQEYSALQNLQTLVHLMEAERGCSWCMAYAMK
jgi:hypothetical protein